MANTYSQMNVHVVFSVRRRENVILTSWRDELHKYIAGILNGSGQFSLAVNGYKDHIHIFFELSPTSSVSQVVQNVKAKSSKWINANAFVKGHFEWQSGYGAFTYSRDQRHNVINYIKTQEEHHKARSFKEEYLDLLNKNDVKYDEAYLFDFYE